jgi:hypothetical protein
MVGASGALWGILGVASALALRPGDTLPAEVQAGFRRSIATNMAIQVAVSFLPGVSWQAHLGGGLVGFALMASGVLRPGARARRALWSAAGALSALALAGCMAAALASGRPWELAAPPALHAEALGDTGLTIDLPARPARRGGGRRARVRRGRRARRRLHGERPGGPAHPPRGRRRARRAGRGGARRARRRARPRGDDRRRRGPQLERLPDGTAVVPAPSRWPTTRGSSGASPSAAARR